MKNLNEKTVAQLHQILDDNQVPFKKKDTKQTLINLITENAKMTDETQSAKDLAEQAFHASIDAGKNKNEVIDAMVEASGKSKAYCTTLYPVLSDFHGKSAPAAERTPSGHKLEAFKIFEELVPADITEEAYPDARVQALAKAEEVTGLTSASVGAHFRNYCKDNDINYSAGGRTSAKKEERVSFIEAALKAGKSRKEIIEAMMAEFGYSEGGAATSYQTTLKENGWSSNSASGGSEVRNEAWTWFKANMNASRQDAIAAFAAMGVSEATASSYYATFELAVELANDLSQAA